MKRNPVGITSGGEQRLHEAIEAQVRREHQDELAAATDKSQKASIEQKIQRKIKAEMKRVASPYSLWSSQCPFLSRKSTSRVDRPCQITLDHCRIKFEQVRLGYSPTASSSFLYEWGWGVKIPNQVMAWSIEQTHQIVEQFWQDGVVRCPDDAGPLKLKLHKLHGGDYDLRAECLVCGKREDLRRGDDPLRHTFRQWTTGEVEQLAESAAKMGASHCPVCSTSIDWQAAPGVLLLRCFRCGNSNQWQNVSRSN